MSKSKVKIFGASGCGNVGDDLIALILQKYLQSSLGDVTEVSLIPQQNQHEELKDTDILVIGGGGLIYDYDINNVRNYCDAVNYAFSYRVLSRRAVRSIQNSSLTVCHIQPTASLLRATWFFFMMTFWHPKRKSLRQRRGQRSPCHWRTGS
jgi:hypothetical protein